MLMDIINIAESTPVEMVLQIRGWIEEIKRNSVEKEHKAAEQGSGVDNAAL